MTWRPYAEFIEREFHRIFLSAHCPQHGRILGPHTLAKTVAQDVREILCPKCGATAVRPLP